NRGGDRLTCQAHCCRIAGHSLDIRAGARLHAGHWSGWAMTAAAVLKVRFDDLSIMARTVYGEARCEPPEGQLAVAHVILNRVQSAVRWGSNIGEVCLKRWQFSCWNPGDRNRELLSRLGLDDAALLACTKICLDALSGIPDPTSGATRYRRVN